MSYKCNYLENIFYMPMQECHNQAVGSDTVFFFFVCFYVYIRCWPMLSIWKVNVASELKTFLRINNVIVLHFYVIVS